jgi:hypothetical protein
MCAEMKGWNSYASSPCIERQMKIWRLFVAWRRVHDVYLLQPAVSPAVGDLLEVILRAKLQALHCTKGLNSSP